MVDKLPNWVEQILKTDDESVCLLDSELRIVECNRGWDKFAVENGGSETSSEQVKGTSIIEVTPQVLRRFYEFKYAEAWHLRGRWIGFDYDCSTAEQYRLFHMSLHAFNDSHLLIVNSPLRRRVSPRFSHEPLLNDARFRDADGKVAMCANCRRSKRRDSANAWDWVPRFISHPEREIAHELCEQCREYFYPAYSAA